MRKTKAQKKNGLRWIAGACLMAFVATPAAALAGSAQEPALSGKPVVSQSGSADEDWPEAKREDLPVSASQAEVVRVDLSCGAKYRDKIRKIRHYGKLEALPVAMIPGMTVGMPLGSIGTAALVGASTTLLTASGYVEGGALAVGGAIILIKHIKAAPYENAYKSIVEAETTLNIPKRDLARLVKKVDRSREYSLDDIALAVRDADRSGDLCPDGKPLTKKAFERAIARRLAGIKDEEKPAFISLPGADSGRDQGPDASDEFDGKDPASSRGADRATAQPQSVPDAASAW